MKILVCLTHVPDTTSKISFTENRLNTQGVSFVIGPYDDYALARAVELKESHQAQVTALHVGSAAAEVSLRKALAIGADNALRIDTPTDTPVDAHYVAHQIHQIAQQNAYDLILMGRESSDFNGGQVHGMVASLLGIACVYPVMHLDIKEQVAYMKVETDTGHVNMEGTLPLVLGCQEPIADWKIPNMRGIMAARSKSLEVLPATEIKAKLQTTSFTMQPARGQVKMVQDTEELVRLLKEEAKVL